MKNMKEARDILGFNLSPSSINTFAGCPYQWKTTYLDGLRSPDNKFTVPGKAFHKIFEVVSKNYSKDELIAGKEEYILDLCMSIPPGEWKHLMKPIFKLYAKAEMKRFTDIMEFTSDNVDEVWDYFVPVENERKYELDDEGITFIADRILNIPAGMGMNEEDALCVFDFKPKGNDYNTKLNRQLTVMAMHLKDEDGNLPLVGGYFYRTGVMLPIKNVHSNSIRSVNKIVDKILNALRSGVFEKKLGWNCKFCTIRMECRAKIPLGEALMKKRERKTFVGGIFDSVNRANLKVVRHNVKRSRPEKEMD